MDSNQRLTDQRQALAYQVSLFLVPVVVCFSLFRAFIGPLYMSAAGFCVVGALLKDLACYREHRRFWLPPGALILILAVAECVTFKASGVAGIFWVYPTILVAFWTLEHDRAAKVIVLSSLLWTAGLAYLMSLEIMARAVLTIVPTALLASMVARLIDAQKEELSRLISVDSLTGALNRRRLDELLSDRVVNCKRYGRPASMLLLDIDHFKLINDELGHEEGDKVLRGLCELIRARIRSTDHLFRFGGEEFIVLMPETDCAGGRVLAEDLRRLVSEADLLADRKVTISVGVGQAHGDDEVEQWLKRYDRALYEAKNAGRDQVRVSAA